MEFIYLFLITHTSIRIHHVHVDMRDTEREAEKRKEMW